MSEGDAGKGGAPARSAVFFSAPRYGLVALILHWLIAILIVIDWAIPHGMDFFSGHDAPLILELHRSIGITILLLVLFRLLWRVLHAGPPLPVGTAPILRLASHASHAALYLLMLAVPVLGMVFTWATGRDISFWGLTLPAPFVPDDALAERCRDWHALAANATLILAGLHSAAALVHQYVLRDHLLDRMLPNGRRS